jgi:amino-acid N-acetyltransferase
MTNTVEAARPADLDAVLQLLRDNALPVDGLSDHLMTTLVVRHGEQIVGSAALEVYGDGALLRSVAVAPGLQRSGLGRTLTDAAIDLARQRSLPALFLLTTTADGYFPRFGFERIERSQVPATVQESVEFKSACPASATVMRKLL